MRHACYGYAIWIISYLNLLVALQFLAVQHFIQLTVDFAEGIGIQVIQMDLSATCSQILVTLTAIFLHEVDQTAQLLLADLFESLL